ncbi:MAG TPA: shikimate dehydrogenase [Bacteroidales bacterium]|nr:shikimate dehydrogenase [Bacteroidales bacterium]
MKIYGLIGYPLSHSFSGRYFAEKFAREGITDCKYNLYPLDRIESLVSLLRDEKDLAGLNVTIPYKEKVLDFLDSTDDCIQQIGAVNTIKIFREGSDIHLKGYNTDVYGFSESLKPLLKPGIQKALVLGTGGASRAVMYALNELGIRVTMVSRNPRVPGHISYEMITADVMADQRLIVNTTPSGMFPDTGSCPPLPYEFLTSGHVLFDLVYNPPETRFMTEGKQKKATVVSGLQMLYLQADKSWEIWNRPDYIIA